MEEKCTNENCKCTGEVVNASNNAPVDSNVPVSEFGDKIDRLLKAKEKKTIKSRHVIQSVAPQEGTTEITTPHGLVVNAPDSQTELIKRLFSDPAAKEMFIDEESEEAYDKQEKKNVFVTKEGVKIDLGDGPAESEYKPGQLKAKREEIYPELVRDEREHRFNEACLLPFRLALLVPFYVMWRKAHGLVMKFI